VPYCADKARSQSCIPLISSMEKDSFVSSRHTRTKSQSEGELLAHWVVLFFCAGILLGGLVLSPPSAGSPYMSIGPIPIPDTCSFQNLTGLPCPGCGLTRSIVTAMRGDFKASLSYHRLGLLTLIYICLQFLYRLIAVCIPPFGKRLCGLGKILNRGIIVLTFLYVLNWGYTLFIQS
jgi:hypothetical protein